MNRSLRTGLVLLIFFVSCSPQWWSSYSIVKEAKGVNGMVVSAHPLASEAGIEVLKQGGNAVDAAIAVQFALAVAYPRAGNLGGGGFMVIHMANGQQETLDFREMAPSGSSRDMYLDHTGNAISEKSREGHLSVGIPGTVDGMFEAHRKYGKTKSIRGLIKPAHELAANGFRITAYEAKGLNEKMDDFKRLNKQTNVFTSQERWRKGDQLIQKDLAATLKRIMEKGRAGFYEGQTADLIIEEMNKGGGIINQSDLKNYVSKWRPPIRFTYKDMDIVSMGPPSSGGILLAQMLKMIEPYPISDYGFQSVESVHLMTEVEKRAYADRSQHLGDADFYDVPVTQLLDDYYLSDRMSDFNPDKATRSKEIKPGEFGFEGEETTHYSIIDVDGNAVSVTTTLNSAYGSKVVVGGAGFFLNNEMDDFSAKPGEPNLYGLVGAEANAIEPGKRMLSSMTPTIVLKNDQPFLILGTPGGSTIITSVFQVMINVVEFGMSLKDAVNAPRFHHQWLPKHLFVEEVAVPNEVRLKLSEMGHRLKERSDIGKVDAILVHANGHYIGVGDKRADDTAIGY